MADYWKSQDRKYCDFCKCWIADNKPSRDFHEKGRRHQENVKKRLKHITKTSARDQREQCKVDASIKVMEAAAMVAYRKDVENNADLTSMAINHKLQTDNLALSGSSTTSGIKKEWHEGKYDDGNTYYFNIMTNEKIFEAPPEGYVTIREIQNDNLSKQVREVEKNRQKEGLRRVQEQKKDEEEERARLAREKLKERRVKEESPEPVYGPIIDPGPTDPYGGWQKVVERPVEDLGLPQTEYYEPIVPVNDEPEPVQKEFKERVVEHISDGGSSSFKKRKFPSGAKRNTRQRLDVD